MSSQKERIKEIGAKVKDMKGEIDVGVKELKSMICDEVVSQMCSCVREMRLRMFEADIFIGKV